MGTKLLHDIAETAHILSISQSSIKRLVDDQKLKPVRIGGRVLFKRVDLEAYVDSLATTETPEPKKRGRPRKSYDVNP